ncbi:MAG: hypothetical protein PHQ98_00135 [Candidatus ainarchaeum sp.]|nr:hypothetical protein [Candidatus ainarchaeum sp.]
MKKMIIILIISLIVANFVFAAPNITQINYNPSPVVPGSTAQILLQIENPDNSSHNNLTISMNEEFPISVVNDKTKNIGNLEKFGKTTVIFDVYIDSKAENKTYYIEFNIEGSDLGATKTEKFPVIVFGNQPNLKIVDSSTDKLIPGQETEIELTIQNIGTSTANSTIIEMPEDRTITATGSVIERDITPLGSSTKYIGEINPNEQKIVTIKIAVNKDAKLKNYNIPINLQYRTQSGEEKTDISYVGFKISGTVDFDATIKDISPILMSNLQSEITVELFNKGVGRAEFTIIDINTNAGTITKNKEFIGKLEPNDVDSIKIKLTPNQYVGMKKETIQLKINYQDVDAIEKTEIIELPIVINSVEQASGQDNSIFGLIINLIILGVIVFIGYKAYKKFIKK